MGELKCPLILAKLIQPKKSYLHQLNDIVTKPKFFLTLMLYLPTQRLFHSRPVRAVLINLGYSENTPDF